MQEIETMYDAMSAPVPREVMMFSATPEPRLINDSSIARMYETMMLLSGMSQPGRTCPRNPENGNPLSLACLGSAFGK